MTDAQGIKALRDFEGDSLNWVQPAILDRYFELLAGGAVYATLKWEHLFGSLATGRTSDLSYTFKRGGFMLPHVTIRKVEYDQDVGVLRMGFGGNGNLELADGRRFSFTRAGFWHPDWAFYSEDGRRICTFKTAFSFTKLQAEVKLEADSRRMPNIALLLVLGWYVIVLQAQESAAASGGAAASSGAVAAAGAPPPGF